MPVFKCKMCGGALEIHENQSVAVCEYCGTQQTLPRLDDERKVNLYDRANHFRRNNEFDKASAIYEQILNEDGTDAEAYWSLVLCRYGIEYVEDPTTHKRIPTVNRAQYTSIFDDDNYRSALQHSDGTQKVVYEQEAKAINEIQKGILEISQKEEPFDVFICYKETDSNGRRTPDSVLAQELYYQLKQEGFKVFFSRITLEDKLGVAYEPYIFAALNSSKVMVVVGTRPEYFNAVWVKNEWSRYLALIKNGAKKILIPAYKDMDPYDLPEEFSHLQAQDMSKLGFMQDLIRGIKKLAQADTQKVATVKETVIAGGGANIEPLLKRAFMFLEDGNWNEADSYCEKVLDIDPENARAYLGKLMASLQVRKQEALKNCSKPFDDEDSFQKVLRFADEELKKEMIGYIDHINTRNENARLEEIYTRAVNAMSRAYSETGYTDAGRLFESISKYQDSSVLAEECYEKAETARKDDILAKGKSKMDDKGNLGYEIANYESAIEIFESISGWRDADECVCECQRKIEELKAKEEAERLERERKAEEERKKAKRRASIAMSIVCAVFAFIIVLNAVIIPNNKYDEAVALMDTDVVEAYEKLVSLNGYKDSEQKADSIYAKYIQTKIGTQDVGDYVTFGKYEQDNDTSNGKEDIEWIVLDKQDGKVLVISKYALDCQPYNALYMPVTWETCSLRRWLNNTFINNAFSSVEQALIPTITVSADKNPVYSTNPGNATQDQVFLLSIDEVNRYFTDDDARLCGATEYTLAKGVDTYEVSSSVDGKFSCRWWLRSPGHNDGGAAYVNNYGALSHNGNYVNFHNSAVRPALWVTLNP